MKNYQLISIVSFTASIIIIFISFHNIDNSVNMCLLDEWTHEKMIGGDVVTMPELYLMGTKGLMMGFILCWVSFLVLLKGETQKSK